jgi:glycosyltransferase involved in cell wall biosynthesis
MSITVGFDLTHARLSRTGLGRYPAELARALEARASVRVVELYAGSVRAPSSTARIVRGLRREGLYYPFMLGRAARGARVDVLHVPTPAPARGGGVPLIVTVHDLLPLRMPQLFTRQTRWHTRLYLPFVRGATRVITPSAYTRAEVIELLGIGEQRVIAVPEAADERFAPLDADRERLRAELGISGRYVLSVGTLEPRKNLATVLRVFRRVSEAMPDVELVIVGGAGWRNQSFESELGRGHAAARVRVTGFVSDARLVELYAGAACFLFPSLGEGFGLPPLEAMACGAPVVMSDRPALPEVAGGAALQAPPLDVEALAAHVTRVLSEPRVAGEMRAAGLARSRQFSWARAAKETERAYREAHEDAAWWSQSTARAQPSASTRS